MLQKLSVIRVVDLLMMIVSVAHVIYIAVETEIWHGSLVRMILYLCCIRLFVRFGLSRFHIVRTSGRLLY